MSNLLAPLGAFPVMTTGGRKRPAKSTELEAGKAQIRETPTLGAQGPHGSRGCGDKEGPSPLRRFLITSLPCKYSYPTGLTSQTSTLFLFSILGSQSVPNFKYHLCADNSQIHISDPEMSPNS